LQLWTDNFGPLGPVILEAGRKLSSEVRKHENPIIGWNHAVPVEYLLFPVISNLV